jgi:hypothetical protein
LKRAMLRPPLWFPATMVSCAAQALGCGGSGTTHGNQDAGAIAVEASVTLLQGPFTCPAVTSFSIDRAELPVGTTAQLDVETAGPPPTAVQWTSTPPSAGDFSDPTSLHPTYRCAAGSRVTVTVELELDVPNLGDVCAGVANTTYSGSIRCE